jgi:hypothetical protein
VPAGAGSFVDDRGGEARRQGQIVGGGRGARAHDNAHDGAHTNYLSEVFRPHARFSCDGDRRRAPGGDSGTPSTATHRRGGIVRANALRRNVPSNSRAVQASAISLTRQKRLRRKQSMPVSLQLQTLKALAKADPSGQYSGRPRDCALPSNNTLMRAERS